MSALEKIPHITLLTLDVTKSEQLIAAVDSIKNEGEGGLDVVINNAAVSHYTPLLDTDIDAAKEVFETNLWSPLKIIKTFVPVLREGKGEKMVVNISSIAGYINLPYLGLFFFFSYSPSSASISSNLSKTKQKKNSHFL